MQEQKFHIGNMDCGNCAREVESGVAKLGGVEHVEVDFISGRMLLIGDVDPKTVEARVHALGKTISSESEGALGPAQEAEPSMQAGGVIGYFLYLNERAETRLALAGGGIVLLAFCLSFLSRVPQSISSAGYVAGLGVTLWPILRSGINNLRINRTFNINLLMSIAAVGAIVIGEYLEGAIVIFLFAIGEALEGYTVSRARQSLSGLLALRPAEATLIMADGERVVPVEQLAVGDLILVKPAAQIPMDGIVIEGQSDVNQAPITGESMPILKTADSIVYAGTLNGGGALRVEITRLAKDNTLNRMIELVSQAQAAQAPSQRLIDQFASWYTPAVVGIAVLIASVPPLFFNAPFWDSPAGHGWLYRALAMLVIACPCALVISTPVTVVSAITAASRRGVLIKGGAFLEKLGQLKAIALDKTGTITTGLPIVKQYRSVDCRTPEVEDCVTCNDLLALAESVETRATHPLATAVVAAAQARAINTRYAAAENVQTLTGRGVQGLVDGRTVTLGSHAWFDDNFPHPADLCAEISAHEASGHTMMMVADDNRVRGYIALADAARESSAGVIDELDQLGIHPVMLTGDNAKVAQQIGQQVGVVDVRAELLPEEKMAAIDQLKQEIGIVGMLGDGINDTPALAAADIGIAMGGAGNAQAMETADVVLMSDDLEQLPMAIRLSQFARKLVAQNVVLSFSVKLIFLLLAVTGITSLWLAILADVGMALLVTLNGMRPLKKFAL